MPVVGVAAYSKIAGISAVAFGWMSILTEVHADPLVWSLQKLLVQPEVGGIDLGNEDVPYVIGYLHEVTQVSK